MITIIPSEALGREWEYPNPWHSVYTSEELKMKPYIKKYFKYFGYDETDAIFCEVCGKIAQDLHHIQARGMGGSKYRDNIENIMALCRPCHEFYGDKKQHKDFLIITHQIKMNK